MFIFLYAIFFISFINSAYSLELKDVFVNKRICYNKKEIILLTRPMFPGYYDLNLKVFNSSNKFKIALVKNHKNLKRNFLRNFLRKRIYMSCEDDLFREFQLSLLLGEKLNKKKVISTTFKRSGLSHYLAFSGFHVSILFFLLTSLLSFLKEKTKFFLSFLFVLLYSFSLNSVSSFRATIFLFFYILERVTGESRDMRKIFLFSIVVSAFYDNMGPGFHLSFSSIFVLIFLLPIFESSVKRLGKVILASILISFVTSFPLLYFFGNTNALSFIYNILFSIPLSVLIFLSFLSLFLPLTFAILLNSFLSKFFYYLIFILEVLNRRLFFNIEYKISFTVLIFFYIFLILFVNLFGKYVDMR